MLKVQNLTKHYGKTAVLNGVSFSLKTPATLALIGTNGAGKSTLLNILTGVTKADKGQAHFNGVDLLKTPTHRLRGNKIARTFQTPRLFNSLSVGENFALVGETPLGFDAHLSAGELSFAECRRVELLRALKINPELIFLDELSAGMVHTQAQELFKEVTSHRITVVAVEHNISLVREFCEYTLALDLGEVIAFGKTDEVLREKAVITKLVGE